MKPEYKQLLLQDLCARLPYGVKFKWCDDFHIDDYYTLIGINEGQIIGRSVNQEDCLFFMGEDKIKPYLRPMSSMTEEETVEYCDLQDKFLLSSQYPVTDGHALFDWLNKKMFDYRGLIDKDFVLSTEVFNPYKE